MKELFDAIYDRWTIDFAGWGGILLYNTEADPDPVYPYATLQLVSATTELADFTNSWENCLIQFNLFDDDPKCTDINAAYKLVKNAFHKHDLVVTDSKTISMVKEIANLIRVEKVWQYNVLFRIILQED